MGPRSGYPAFGRRSQENHFLNSPPNLQLPKVENPPRCPPTRPTSNSSLYRAPTTPRTWYEPSPSPEASRTPNLLTETHPPGPQNNSPNRPRRHPRRRPSLRRSLATSTSHAKVRQSRCSRTSPRRLHQHAPRALGTDAGRGVPHPECEAAAGW